MPVDEQITIISSDFLSLGSKHWMYGIFCIPFLASSGKLSVKS